MGETTRPWEALMNRIEIDRVVCEGLGKLPGQSLYEAALCMVRHGLGTTQQRVAAHCILNSTLPPWDNMERAAMWLGIVAPTTRRRRNGGAP